LTQVTPEATPRWRRAIIAALSTAADHIITGLAMAAAATHPEAFPTLPVEPDPGGPASEPPAAPEA
jgi:hypothetical protein